MTKGKDLNRMWNVGARHALYSTFGTFYMILEDFPGALFDPHGYILFETREDFLTCRYLNIGKRLNVSSGIKNIPGYKRMR